ncbi:hypothetical protein [Nocardioides zeae]
MTVPITGRLVRPDSIELFLTSYLPIEHPECPRSSARRTPMRAEPV